METREQAARVAAMLRTELHVEVQLIDGGRGEFTVLVDGRKVAEKNGDTLPTPEEIRNAVTSAAPATATA